MPPFVRGKTYGLGMQKPDSVFGGITTELNETKAKNLGALADKHGIAIGFHNHIQLTPTTY